MGTTFAKRVGFVCKGLILCLILVVFFGITTRNAEIAYAARGSARYCVCLETGEIFVSENPNVRLPMASTTKIMTALVVIENCLPDEIVVVPKEAIGVEGSSIYLQSDDRYTVEELLYGLMMRSGNDAAVALAVHCAGSVDAFVNMMNAVAKDMGVENTHFANPHGLHDPDHFTSAKDLATIACVAMNNPLFRTIVGTKSITIGEGEKRRCWSNKNAILRTFPGGNGIKTGFTKDAGRCLVASATRENRTVISVVLNRYDMFGECKTMMENAFLQMEIPS